MKELTEVELYPVIIFINVALYENHVAIYKVKARCFGLLGWSKRNLRSACPLSRSPNLGDVFLVPQNNLCLQRQGLNLGNNLSLKIDLNRCFGSSVF